MTFLLKPSFKGVGGGVPGLPINSRTVGLDGVNPTLAIPANPYRTRLIIQHLDNAVRVDFEYGFPPVYGQSFFIDPRGNVDEDSNVPTGDVWLLSSKNGHLVKVGDG